MQTETILAHNSQIKEVFVSVIGEVLASPLNAKFKVQQYFKDGSVFDRWITNALSRGENIFIGQPLSIQQLISQEDIAYLFS